ncbi:MAG: hypothetical protein ABL957_16445 [Parvularculaceae bacterium]
MSVQILAAVLPLLLVACASAPGDPSLIVRGDRLFVPIEINGIATEALLDSAAEATFVDAAFAREISLATAGAASRAARAGPKK